MKKKSTSQSAPARRSLGEGGFFNLRVLIAALFCLVGVAARQDAPGTQTPDVVRLVGPVVMNTHLRDLPYIPPAPQILKERMIPHTRPGLQEPAQSETSAFPQFQSLLKDFFETIPNMPPPLLTFDGTNFSTSGCG